MRCARWGGIAAPARIRSGGDGISRKWAARFARRDRSPGGQGVEHVIVIPYFLTLGMHLQRDLPRLVEEIRVVHPGMEIHVTPPLDGHPD